MLIKPTIYIVLGIIIGIAFTTLCTSTSQRPQTTQITKSSVLKEQTTKTEIRFQHKVDSLNTIAQNLNNKLTNNKAALALAKNITLVLQTQLVAAQENTKTSSTNQYDSINCLPTDNLLTEFIEANTNKDSLYETIDSTRIQQLQNMDAALAVKDSMYSALKQSFNYSISQQDILFTQNKFLNKQIKMQKLKSKIVTAALLIASATAANYLFKQ